MYRWHCTQFPDSLRPAFPGQILLLDEPLEEIEQEFRYFWTVFMTLNGDALQNHSFFSVSTRKLDYSKELDLMQDNQLPPPYEWIPSTTSFLRSTWTRLRRRSPSPHLHLDEVDREENEFAVERHESIQRIRTREIQNSYGKHRVELLSPQAQTRLEEFNFVSIDLKSVEERLYLLKSALDSLSAATEAVKKSESLLETLILDFNADDSSASESDASEQETVSDDGEFCFPSFIGFEVVDAGHRKLIQFQHFDDSLHEKLTLPLQWQLNDLHCLLAPINRRTELLQKLADAVEEREKAAKEVQSASASKLAAKQAKLEKICMDMEDLKQKIAPLSSSLLAQLPQWTQVSTELVFKELEKFKKQ